MEEETDRAVVSKGFWRDAGLRYLGTVLAGAVATLALRVIGVLDKNPVIAAIVCLVTGFLLAFWVLQKQQRDLKNQNDRQTRRLDKLTADRDGMKKKLDWLDGNIGRIETDKSIGRFWCQSVSASRPVRPKLGVDRTTRFIAVVNLKGGVGKTTVSANLAMAIAERLAFDERILLVDIDFQGTLSDRMIELSKRSQFLESPQIDHDLCTSTRLIQNKTLQSGEFVGLIQRAADSSKIDIIPAHERLDQADTLELIRAVTKPNYEVRFRHVPNLHSLDVYPKYRYVIFDCPPRLTVSCISALAAADAFVIPTKLQADSIDAIGRTLKWVSELEKSEVTDAVPLGIVANEVRIHGGRPMRTYGDSYQLLKTRSENWSREYGHEIRVFESLVSHFKDFGTLQGGQTAYKHLADAKPVFDPLAEELVARMDKLVRA